MQERHIEDKKRTVIFLMMGISGKMVMNRYLYNISDIFYSITAQEEMKVMVTYNPEYNFNIFNTPNQLQTLSSNEKSIMLMKDNKNIKFDVVMTTLHGAIYVCYICHRHKSGVIATETRTEMSTQSMHELVGH